MSSSCQQGNYIYTFAGASAVDYKDDEINPTQFINTIEKIDAKRLLDGQQEI